MDNREKNRRSLIRDLLIYLNKLLSTAPISKKF